jgi:hypothetical protein
MTFGVLLLGLAGLAAVAALLLHAHRLWSVALFLPFWVGALGVFQATGMT